MLMMPREIKRKSKLSRKNIISNIFGIDKVAKTAITEGRMSLHDL